MGDDFLIFPRVRSVTERRSTPELHVIHVSGIA